MSFWISKHSFTTFLFFKISMPHEYWQSCTGRNFKCLKFISFITTIITSYHSQKVKALVTQLYPALCYSMPL